MTDRALLVGINAYPAAPLRGCINDIQDMANRLVESFSFPRENVELIADGRATKENILDRLRELALSTRPGDRGLFHFSGHGVQLPTGSSGEEDDGLDEAICPVDYDWGDLGSFIRDKDFRRLLASLPSGASFVWVSDSCHSGDLTKALTDPSKALSRYLQPPPDLDWRIQTLRARSLRSRTFRQTADQLRLALIAGCKPEQTSADAFFDGRPNGALTYYLLRELRVDGGREVTLRLLLDRVRQSLKGGGYSQDPVLEGDQEQLGRAFLTQPAADPGVAAPWLELFQEIDRRATRDAAFRQELLARGVETARTLGTALNLNLSSSRADAAPAPRGGTVVRAFWWGFHIEVSHQDLQSFLDVATPINAVAAAIGPATGPAAPFVSLAAAFIAGALDLLRGMDRGRGVYVSMSWFAPGVFVPTSA